MAQLEGQQAASAERVKEVSPDEQEMLRALGYVADE